jgi:4-amino-4-deoxy-L-arabinose transferase-like glycosyltransferase
MSIKFYQRPAFIFSVLSILFALTIYFLREPIFYSDQGSYTYFSWQLTQGHIVLDKVTFANRLGILFQEALFIKLFGVSNFTVLLPHILTTIIAVAFSYKVLKSFFTEPVALAFCCLYFFNPLTIHLTTSLLPDMLFTNFIWISFLIYVNARKNNNDKILTGILFSVCFIMSFLIKETVVYYAVLFAVFAIYDLLKKRMQKFWTAAFFCGTIFVVAYLLFYKLKTGDAFFRLTIIETQYNVTGLLKLLKRVTYKPIIDIFIEQPGFSILFFPLIIFLLTKNIFSQNPLKIFTLSFLLILILHWIGSTSLKTFNPLPLVGRMWMDMRPFIILFTILAIHYSVINKIFKIKILVVAFALILVLITLKNKPAFRYDLIVFIGILPFILSGKFSNSYLKNIPIFIYCLFTFGVSFYIYRSNPSYARSEKIEQKIIGSLKDDARILVLTDDRLSSPEFCRLPFNYKKKFKGVFASYKNESQINYSDFDSVYILENMRLSFAISDSLKKYSAVMFQNQDMVLYKTDKQAYSKK